MTCPVDEPRATANAGSRGSQENDRWIDWFASIVGPVVVSALIGCIWLASALHARAPKLEIVTSATHDSTAWQVAGRVFMGADGQPVRARVWAVAADSAGNRFSPPDSATNAAGEFRIAPIPIFLTGDSARQISDISVFAAAQTPGDSARLLRERNVLRLTRFGRVFQLEASPFTFLSIGLAFFLTILIGIVQIDPAALRTKRAKYCTLIVLCFLFTFSMVGLIAVGLHTVNANAIRGDVMSLGFANIYRGSYVKDQPSEWLFSLTTPPTGGDEPTSGFGAPLWLLLVAVLGSASFTIALLVKHVKEPVDFQDEKMFRTRIEELVRHQFYILFAPLGGVVVYQLIVGAGAGSVQATVAVAMLAAGVAVNLLLDMALKAVQGALKSQ
jgi:hypothetical protein